MPIGRTAKTIRVKWGADRGRMVSCREMWDTLTPQEQNVARFLTVGLENKIIAKHLGITPKTLVVHRGNLLRKLGGVSMHGVPIVVMTALGMVGAFEI